MNLISELYYYYYLYYFRVVGKPLNYTMVDFHSSRPGHDLRYAISGQLLKTLGWEPTTKLSERIIEFSQWMLDNPRWLAMDPSLASETASCLI